VICSLARTSRLSSLTANTIGDAWGEAWCQRLLAGGYAISNLGVHVGSTRSGKYPLDGVRDRRDWSECPADRGRLAITGEVARPSAGYSVVSWGATVTPHLADWVARWAGNNHGTLLQLHGRGSVAASRVHLHPDGLLAPLPSTPSGLSTSSARMFAISAA
jgi:hypothetical protein